MAELNATGSGLVYSTYLGGSGSDRFTSGPHPGGLIAVDGAGAAYVTGYAGSANFPVTPGAFETTGGGAFVSKLDPGKVGPASLVYSTFLAGAADGGRGIAVDSAGDAYVTGYSYAPAFPTTLGAYRTTGDGAFLTKFNPTGSGLIYSTWLSSSNGGSSSTLGLGVALNSAGDAYVTGYTNSPDFPTTVGAYQRVFNAFNYDEAFVTEFSPDGSSLVYSTYLGGSGHDRGLGIAVDSFGNAYVTGYTTSANFPTASAVQPTFGGSYSDAFVAKINPSLSGPASLIYSTYLGGTDSDKGNGIAVDGSSNAYVTGMTGIGFPTTAGAFQLRKSGGADAFVAKISSGAALMATSSPAAMHKTKANPLTSAQVQPLLAEALARWQSAGADTSALRGIDIRIADLGGTTLGLASGHTIWLDDNAAGWGWFVDRTPHDNSEFTTPGNQGEKHHMDLLTVLMHETGHILGRQHDESGVMAETLAAGTRPGRAPDADAARLVSDFLFASPATDGGTPAFGHSAFGRGRKTR